MNTPLQVTHSTSDRAIYFRIMRLQEYEKWRWDDPRRWLPLIVNGEYLPITVNKQ